MNAPTSVTASKRQLVRGKLPIPPKLRVEKPKDLIDLLQTAIEVEHSTIPAYLCALYSIKDGTNQEAAQIIKSVVLEEMLHMILAANVLNAIGGHPSVNSRRFVPDYPNVPLFSFPVHLEAFSKSSIDTFVNIESAVPPPGGNGNTIPHYYAAIEQGLIDLDKQGIFKDAAKRTARQITPEYYYGGGGEPVPVTDLCSALQALKEIVGQGEGVHHTFFDGDQEFGEVEEIAHYFRFKEIYHERYYDLARDKPMPETEPSGKPLAVHWDQVYPMRQDPKMAQYPEGSEVRRKMVEFNRTYTALLDELHTALNGKPQRLMQSVVRMYDLKYQAVELMKIPSGDGETTAGPSFEYVKESD
jgi:hypothetical protein